MSSRILLQRGFTMLEVLIALMVFALISMMAWQILHGAMENAAFTDKQTANLSQLQLTYSRLERDLTQMLPRAVNGDDRAFSLSGNALALTTQDNLASFGRPQEPDILRVTWQLDANTLWREVSPALDLASNTPGTRVPVLEHVKSWQWRMFDGGWRNDWQNKTAVPQGVELTLTLDNDEQWRWVFVASEGWPIEADGAPGAESPPSAYPQAAGGGEASGQPSADAATPAPNAATPATGQPTTANPGATP